MWWWLVDNSWRIIGSKQLTLIWGASLAQVEVHKVLAGGFIWINQLFQIHSSSLGLNCCGACILWLSERVKDDKTVDLGHGNRNNIKLAIKDIN